VQIIGPSRLSISSTSATLQPKQFFTQFQPFTFLTTNAHARTTLKIQLCLPPPTQHIFTVLCAVLHQAQQHCNPNRFTHNSSPTHSIQQTRMREFHQQAVWGPSKICFHNTILPVTFFYSFTRFYFFTLSSHWTFHIRGSQLFRQVHPNAFLLLIEHSIYNL